MSLSKIREFVSNTRNKYLQKKQYSKLKKDFEQDFQLFANQSKLVNREDFHIFWSEKYRVLNEKSATTHFDHHYVYHTSWAARKLAEKPVKVHTDISSCIRFNTIASAFVPIEFYDYRPANITLSNFTSQHADLTKLPFDDNSIESLSCMHVIEHIGLGRYGDPIDPNGDLKAMNELIRVLAKNGNLYVVFPVGKPSVCFNSHRIYAPTKILDYFSTLQLKEFSVVVDSGEFFNNVEPENYKSQNYACGMYHFRKE